MKKILFFLLFSIAAQAQIINIPDPVFKALLLAANPSLNIAKNVANPLANNVYCTIDTNANGEIEVAEAAVITALYIAHLNIEDLTGIEYFTGLKILHAQDNNFPYLDVTTMPQLITLMCSHNAITNPMDLSQCPNLRYASIYNNPIPSVNVSGLTQLTNLDIEVTQITSVDLSDLTALERFNGSFTPLGTLDFSNNPAVENIQCQQCSLTSINVANTPALDYLRVPINSLTSIDVSGSPALTTLHVGSNQISSIDVTMLPLLTTLGCSSNPITSVDVSNQSLLTSLSCGGPQLTTLFMKNGANETLTLTNATALEFICADETQLAPVQAEANADANPNVVVTSYCSFTPGGDYNTITGHISYDSDNDGCDAQDIKADYLRVNLSGAASGATYINGAGNYSFYVGAGNHTVTPQMEHPDYFHITPVSQTADFPLLDNTTLVRDFCLTANGFHPDMEIVLLPLVGARAGFDAHYQLVFRNKGNQTMTGQITVAFEGDRLDFVSASAPTASQTDNLLMWDYNNLLPFETRAINFWLAVNGPTDEPPVNDGDVLSFTAGMNFLSDDPTPYDNYFDFDQMVVNSLDPNTKTCLEGDTVTTELIGEYLHYNINFENIGTADAVNVVVKDVIDTTQFDLATLQIMYASHAVYTRLNGNIVEFIFEGINLPPSIVNPIGGHGNVLFKIKTLPTLQAGDQVSNTANIYFDYNHPIETNEARTTFQTLRRSEFKTDASVKVYPNPARRSVWVKAKSNIQSIAVFDVQGRILQTSIENKNTATLDISARSSGIYFLKITTADGIKVEQIIKE
ncbi:DUF7619 domain-containing protein [Flavobacterium caeni]|uniref:Conserved repeat domain-containing protein/Por secretion system C-terminal sorting domain-containing protein n=1 Tax=Flavobacterium caeni TaxID=490189 RepID=A0A1G5ANE7_9FLAO|nr:T9SS type A sorting domain-containing protein [Flavobacterium caeni]SCX79397.1 conserved repeat domain-containing protein/Por secretion system C-terminal sorting domain-containing protein [Flavobacterium caeni]